MKKNWTRFRALSWWKQTLAWVGVAFVAFIVLAAIVGESSESEVTTEAVTAEEKLEPESEPSSEEPERISPAQTFNRIYVSSDRGKWCSATDLQDRAFERELFEGNYKVMVDDLPANVTPAPMGRTFDYVWKYCLSQLESLSAAETVARIYGDGQDWCASFGLAGSDEQELRRDFRDPYRIAARDLYEKGYKPAPANAVFDELLTRC